MALSLSIAGTTTSLIAYSIEEALLDAGDAVHDVRLDSRLMKAPISDAEF